MGLQPVSFCPPPAGNLCWRTWSHDREDQSCWLKEQAGGGGGHLPGALTSLWVSHSSIWDTEGTLEIVETTDG